MWLRRLAVHRGGVSVYDQRFHEGVNIIHGENGSGKSTIMDFMFYALGGEGIEWKEHAALCDAVTAEVQMNDSVLTLRREVSTERQRPCRSSSVGWTKQQRTASVDGKPFHFVARKAASRLVKCCSEP
jgi:DNA repair exonuclease SbcCD ATPase subunit